MKNLIALFVVCVMCSVMFSCTSKRETIVKSNLSECGMSSVELESVTMTETVISDRECYIQLYSYTGERLLFYMGVTGEKNPKDQEELDKYYKLVSESKGELKFYKIETNSKVNGSVSIFYFNDKDELIKSIYKS